MIHDDLKSKKRWEEQSEPGGPRCSAAASHSFGQLGATRTRQEGSAAGGTKKIEPGRPHDPGRKRSQAEHVEEACEDLDESGQMVGGNIWLPNSSECVAEFIEAVEGGAQRAFLSPSTSL